MRWLLSLLLTGSLVGAACEPPPERDPSCDDGRATCQMLPPECGADEILAEQAGCFVCVNPATCAPWGAATCQADAECPLAERCDDCGSSSCPVCNDCVAACVSHGCPTEPVILCRSVRPDCGAGGVAVVEAGCWQCVDRATCAPLP